MPVEDQRGPNNYLYSGPLLTTATTMSAPPGEGLDGRLGKTPSDTTPDRETCSGNLETTPAGSAPPERGLVLPDTWYNRECVPFARAVGDWSQAQEWRGHGHVILEVGS